jgi:hypothetical protein
VFGIVADTTRTQPIKINLVANLPSKVTVMVVHKGRRPTMNDGRRESDTNSDQHRSTQPITRTVPAPEQRDRGWSEYAASWLNSK